MFVRHRICEGLTGIGNSEPIVLENNVKLKDKTFWDEFYEAAAKAFPLIQRCEGFDYALRDTEFRFGIEPSYIQDPYLVVSFFFPDKGSCYIERGLATGFYGSKVVYKTKFYRDYKRESKFIRFIDEWYDKIKSVKW